MLRDQIIKTLFECTREAKEKKLNTLQTINISKFTRQLRATKTANSKTKKRKQSTSRPRCRKNVTCGKQNFYIAHMLIWCAIEFAQSLYSSISSDYFALELENSTQPTHLMQMIVFFSLRRTFYFIGYAAHKHIQLLPPEMHNFANEMNVFVKTDKQYTHTNAHERVTEHFQFLQLIGHDLSLFWDWPHYYYSFSLLLICLLFFDQRQCNKYERVNLLLICP